MILDEVIRSNLSADMVTNRLRIAHGRVRAIAPGCTVVPRNFDPSGSRVHLLKREMRLFTILSISDTPRNGSDHCADQ
jgi:hypothetical protein